MFRDATRAVKLVAAAMTTAEFDPVRLEGCAGDGWTTLTELADTLVRDHGLPFRTAHAIAGRLITARQQDADRPLADVLADVSKEVAGAPIVYSEAALAKVLSPRYFVTVRRTLGGPAPEETARAAGVSRQLLGADDAWWEQATNALADAEHRLAERSAAL